MKRQIFQPTDRIEEIFALPFKTRTLGVSRGALRVALYAIHRCHLAPYTTDSVWVPLSSQMMGKIAGRISVWITVKNLLCVNGFLDCDGKSRHGTKCFSFRLGPKLRDAEWRSAAVAEETKKGRKERAGKLAAAPCNSQEVKWEVVAHKFPAIPDGRPLVSGLSIDKVKAHRILKEIAARRGWSRRTLESWHARVDEFSAAYSVGKTGRLFTDGNMLPKEVRAALLIDGEETTEIDVKNCQPLLLAAIYASPSEESARWKALCEAGQVYEDFAADLGMSRKEAKGEHFLPLLFGGKRPLAEAYFRDRFPELFARIKSFARTGEKSLAHVLQRMESEIIVKGFSVAFRALSVHDAVRVKKADEPAARAMILDLFWNLHGLRPILDPPSQCLPDGVSRKDRTKERRRGYLGGKKRRKLRKGKSCQSPTPRRFCAVRPSNGGRKRGKRAPIRPCVSQEEMRFSTKGGGGMFLTNLNC